MTKVAPTTREDIVEAARWELLLMTDLLRALAVTNISCSKEIDGSVIEWLANKIDVEINKIEVAMMPGRAV